MNIKILILLLFFPGILMSQDFSFEKKLYDSYKKWSENSINHRRFKHSDVKPLIEKLKQNAEFSISQIGASEQGREIYLIKLGRGQTKVFLWSQMHGDEPTATMALFDIFNFFSEKNEFDGIKNEILDNLTLYIIPMLNPDGAELYQRRNINQIDINRDAVKQQSVEGRLLKSIYDSLKMDFGFNLHDQGSKYSVGHSPKTAAISFLAPPFNDEKEVNMTRGRAIELIGYLNTMLGGFIPGHIAKYSDDFEPRAFGDNFQKWGMSTILIESGGWVGDAEKQFLRKMNFVILLSAFKSIATGNYQSISSEIYESIPFNNNFIYDLVLRNLSIIMADSTAIVDIAVNRIENNTSDKKSFFFKSTIEEIGDTSGYFGIEEFDMTGRDLVPGRIYPKEFDSLSNITGLNFEELLSEGYLYLRVKNFDSLEISKRRPMIPINIIFNSAREEFTEGIQVGETADFIIKKGDFIEFVCVNGFLYSVKNKSGKIFNGSIIR